GVSAIAGIFNLDTPVRSGSLEALAWATRAGTPGMCWAEGRIALGRGASGILQVDGQGRVLLADARIDNAAELRRSLGPTAASRVPGRSAVVERADDHGELILAAFARWGERCVDHLVGDFAFALWDATEQTLFCARDPMGVRPFYYHQSDGHFCFASDLRA